MENIEVSGFSDLKSFSQDALKKTDAKCTSDLEKTPKEILKELHSSANHCLISTSSTFSLAQTMANLGSLQVVINEDSKKLQKTITCLTKVAVLLAIIQLFATCVQIYITIFK